MELRNIEFVYVGIGIVILILIISAILFKRKEKYKNGQKVVMPEYMQNDSYYKRKLRMFTVFKFLIAFFCILSIIASSVLIARPFETETKEIERNSRDIIICLDVSWSVIELDGQVIESIKETVKGLDGDRVGLDIFNTSTVTLCPLTDDYQYVLDLLDLLEECIEIEKGGDYSVANSFGMNDEYELSSFIFATLAGGTTTGNDVWGSSLIGSGLASSVLHFPDLDEDVEKSRAIILVSDNDEQASVRPLYTLEEAADLCTEKGITVFGIGPREMFKDLAADMQDAVESTGGKFYLEKANGDANDIIDDIHKLSMHTEKTEVSTNETDTPELMFVVLLISTGLLMIFTRLAKL